MDPCNSSKRQRVHLQIGSTLCTLQSSSLGVGWVESTRVEGLGALLDRTKERVFLVLDRFLWGSETDRTWLDKCLLLLERTRLGRDYFLGS
jgi:hypothetical protein